MTLSLDTAYRSFGGEVEASSTPTICRLPDSRRHQLWAIARREIVRRKGRSLHLSADEWRPVRIGSTELIQKERRTQSVWRATSSRLIDIPETAFANRRLVPEVPSEFRKP